MSIRSALSGLPIRTKLLAACLAILVPFAAASVGVAYTVMRGALERQIHSELRNATETLRGTVQTAVGVSIRNYLRSVAETNRELVAHFHGEVLRGALTEAEAKAQAARAVVGQTIGRTGYLYCVDSRGTAAVHPSKEVQGRNFAEQPFVAEQMRRKTGYLEYEWGNPGEAAARPKALSMAYFEPWDWIVTATAYQAEFEELVNTEDFRHSVAALRFGRSGYSFVFDLAGTLIIHPALPGQNAFELEGGQETAFVREMIRTRRGELTYRWQNPGDPAPRQKVVVYDFVPETQWIVASSAYLDDLYEPLAAMRNRIAAAALFCLAVGVALVARVSASITRPLGLLADHLARGAEGDYSVRSLHRGGDEVGRLSAFFDRFMEALDRESQERYRSLMAAAPDPIMVLDPGGRVTYLNLAFTAVFGWRLEDFEQGAAHDFVPEAERDPARRVFLALCQGAAVSAGETTRVTRDGERLQVSVSGGPFRGAGGAVEGCILILRDVTEFKELEREVIEADERERIRIGQDLHDDLAPHLIGIELKCRLLQRRLADQSPDLEGQAGRIGELVGEATRKTRALARGLCPVHLEEEGLEVALRQLVEMVEAVFGVPCEFRPGAGVTVGGSAAVHVYRIAQEALHNAVKHANAQGIALGLEHRDGRGVLEVTDDGVGLAAGAAGRGMGLRIMAFRAAMIGAELELGPGDPGGTRVRLTLKRDPDQEEGNP
ncbi:MAG: cache domain-containing protein [Deferrisomatales bacterium]